MTHISDNGQNRPRDLDPLLQQISQAHTSPDDESITAAAIIASVNFLEQLPPEIHWLCSSSPLSPVVVHAVQLWGYGEPPAQAALEKFKPALAATLSRCPDCAVEWQGRCRRELKRIFREVYLYDEGSTAEFFIALENWDAERVTEGLVNAMMVVERIPMAWKHVEVKGPLVESLAATNLLLKVGVHWKELFGRLDKMPVGFGEKWLPGALFLIFDSDDSVRLFGEQMFRKRDRKISVSEFESDLLKPLVTLMKRGIERVCLTVTKLTLGKQSRVNGSKNPMEWDQFNPSMFRSFSDTTQSDITTIRSAQVTNISSVYLRNAFSYNAHYVCSILANFFIWNMATYNNYSIKFNRPNLLKFLIRKYPHPTRFTSSRYRIIRST